MAKRKILIVEDEGIVALHIENSLKSLGYEVAGMASYGEEAIKKAQDTHPDLVLMDIVLKGEIDGIEACEKIRSLFDIPVIFLTAFGDEDTLQRAKLTEPFGYILKPFKEKELHIAIDIALYKHEMESKLKRMEQWLAITLRSIGDGVIATDKMGCIIFLNPVAEALTGWKQEDALGKKLTDVYNVVNEKLINRDGNEIPIDGSEAPIRDEKGDISGAVFIFRDITQRKLAEEELKKHREHLEELVNERTREVRLAKEDAENANKAKTNFLHTMSHELRTPLNAVLGFSEMLKQRTSGELNEKQEHFIDNIITGGNNLHNIISQILDVVQMDEGTLELHIEKIPVPETVDEFIGVIKEKAAKKNVLIEKTLDPELEYIEADKQKFKQVFINLLDNAVKFSKDEGGTVTINAKKEGDMGRFSVSDRGIGIKEEDIEKIFRKFTQLDSGTSRKYGGTGIGLAITKQFVELHGGKIYVESKYGIGSTFTFLIPLKAKNGEL